MPEREGELPAAADVELLAAAEIEVAVLKVNVGMAHPAVRDAQQYLGSRWCGGGCLGCLKRLGILDQRLTMHR